MRTSCFLRIGAAWSPVFAAAAKPNGFPGNSRWWATVWCGLFILGAAVLTVGCGQGGSDPARLPVYGTLTLTDSEKIDGQISFTPVPRSPGPVAVTTVVKGSYQFNKTNGPIPGRYDVTVQQGAAGAAASSGHPDRRGRRPGPVVAASSRAPKPGSATAAAGSPTKKGSWKLKADVPANGPYNIDFKLD